MQIIDGYCGAPNIYADDVGQYNISMWGPGDWVLPVGEQLGYELISNNEIQIKDGLFITQGRRGVMKKGSVESCIIENGTQAENRNDLIVIEYARDASSMEESHVLKVIRGIPGETAVDPEITEGNIPEGALIHQMPLYRVRLEGLNIIAVEKLFQVGKISPETVDPMTATEVGFAADAKKTKDALSKQNDNIAGLTTRIQSFENTKSEIVSSGLGQAFKLTAASTWAAVVSVIKGVVNRGALNWSGINTTKTVDAGYYTGGTLDSRPSYNKGVADADGRSNPNSANYKAGYSAGVAAQKNSTGLTKVIDTTGKTDSNKHYAATVNANTGTKYMIVSYTTRGNTTQASLEHSVAVTNGSITNLFASGGTSNSNCKVWYFIKSNAAAVSTITLTAGRDDATARIAVFRIY